MNKSIIIEALQKLESMKLIRLNRIIGNWYSIYCPFHNDGNEKKPSCGVLLHDETRNGQTYSIGMFHCFSCSAVYSFQDGISKILKERGVSDRSGLDWLKENIGEFEESVKGFKSISLEGIDNYGLISMYYIYYGQALQTMGKNDDALGLYDEYLTEYDRFPKDGIIAERDKVLGQMH